VKLGEPGSICDRPRETDDVRQPVPRDVGQKQCEVALVGLEGEHQALFAHDLGREDGEVPDMGSDVDERHPGLESRREVRRLARLPDAVLEEQRGNERILIVNEQRSELRHSRHGAGRTATHWRFAA
jgi:hypothetical protein